MHLLLCYALPPPLIGLPHSVRTSVPPLLRSSHSVRTILLLYLHPVASPSTGRTPPRFTVAYYYRPPSEHRTHTGRNQDAPRGHGHNSRDTVHTSTVACFNCNEPSQRRVLGNDDDSHRRRQLNVHSRTLPTPPKMNLTRLPAPHLGTTAPSTIIHLHQLVNDSPQPSPPCCSAERRSPAPRR